MNASCSVLDTTNWRQNTKRPRNVLQCGFMLLLFEKMIKERKYKSCQGSLAGGPTRPWGRPVCQVSLATQTERKRVKQRVTEDCSRTKINFLVDFSWLHGANSSWVLAPSERGFPSPQKQLPAWRVSPPAPVSSCQQAAPLTVHGCLRVGLPLLPLLLPLLSRVFLLTKRRRNLRTTEWTPKTFFFLTESLLSPPSLLLQLWWCKAAESHAHFR